MPSQNDPLFQQKISGNKIFSTLASGANEPIPKPREFYKYQQSLHRFMTHYHKCLVMWSPGTGKSGNTGFSEKLRRDTLGTMSTNWVDEYITTKKTFIKQVIILVKNKTLQDQIKNDIVCKFSAAETYMTEKIIGKPGMKSSTRKGNITREINKYYRVETHTKFAKDLYEKRYTREDFERDYSSTLFIVDEVHNLRIESIPIEDETIAGHILKTKEEKDAKQQRKIYDTYWELFHSIKRSKILLMTATPMINSVIEDGLIMNLILPENEIDINGNIISRNQMPVDRSSERFYIKESDVGDFEKFYNGLISYVGQSDMFAIPVEQGTPLTKPYKFKGTNITPKLKIYPLKMEEKIIFDDGTSIPGQGEVYNSVSGSVHDSSFRIHERQASNFIFPDGSYGMAGVRKWIKGAKGNSDSKDITYYEPIDMLVPFIRDSRLLKGLSVKFWAAIELTEQTNGNCFVFSPFRTGSGAFLLGMCYRYNKGYEQFMEKSSIMIGRTGARTFCGDFSEENNQTDQSSPYQSRARINPRYPRKKRYAIITSGTSDNEIDIILQTFNSWDNRHGDYIKLLIVTPIAREGINVSNVISYIPLGPNWNPGQGTQAENRVFRTTSHVYLLEEDKERLRKEGKDESLAKIYVNIFNLAAMSSLSSILSADLSMYAISEGKDIGFKYIESIKHYYAWDAQINRDRNEAALKRNKYADESISVGGFANDPPTEIDSSAYDILYSEKDIDTLISYIKDIFSNLFSLSINEIHIKLQDYPEKYTKAYTIRALHKIINNKITLVDKYGYYVYMREDGDQFYVLRDYPLADKLNNSGEKILDYYSKNLIGTISNDISEYISQLKNDENIKLKSRLDTITVTDPNYEILFDQLSIINKIEKFENAVYRIYVTGNPTNKDNYVFNKYKNEYFYEIYEPAGYINEVATRMSMKNKGRGRKANPGTVPSLDNLGINVPSVPTPGQPGVNNVKVYVHTLYSLTVKKDTYSVSSKVAKIIGKLRILKPTENIGWRDLSVYENLVYTDIINKSKERVLDKYEQLPFYGIIASDKKFRIRNKMDEVSNPNGQTRKRGRVAQTYDLSDLYKFIWELQIPLPEPQNDQLSLQEKYSYLYTKGLDTPGDPISNYTSERVNYYFSLIQFRFTKKKLAEAIMVSLREKGWLYEE